MWGAVRTAPVRPFPSAAVGRMLAKAGVVGHSASRSPLGIVTRACQVRGSVSGEAASLILVLRQSGVEHSDHSAAVSVAARRQAQMPPAESEILKVSAQSKPSAVA